MLFCGCHPRQYSSLTCLRLSVIVCRDHYSGCMRVLAYANVSVCGARYKTRPGLTYHYTHSHKEKPAANIPADEEASQESGLVSTPVSPQTQQSQQFEQQQTTTGWSKFQDSYVTFLNAPGNH